MSRMEFDDNQILLSRYFSMEELGGQSMRILCLINDDEADSKELKEISEELWGILTKAVFPIFGI
jgi:hypothetical protein